MTALSCATCLHAILFVSFFSASASEDPGPEGGDFAKHLQVLGVQEDATPLTVQLAYMNVTSTYSHGKAVGPAQLQRVINAQNAFDGLSSEDSKQETLGLLKYFDLVKRLRSDDDLRSFTEFRPGVASQLRIVFVVEDGEERLWMAYSIAAQLMGRVRVAQIGGGDTRSSSGPGQFFASLKVRKFPAAVIYDPVSRAVRVSYALEGVRQEAGRFLNGLAPPSDRMSRVQELDGASLPARCESAWPGGREANAPGGGDCSWALVLVTPEAFEIAGEMPPLRQFADACRSMSGDTQLSRISACFWLRLARADPAWKDHIPGADAGPKVIAVRLPEGGASAGIAVAADTLLSGPGSQVMQWLREVHGGRVETNTFAKGVLPPLPDPMGLREEPPEDFAASTLKQFFGLFGDLQGKFEANFERYQREFEHLDTEEKCMAVGIGMCFLMLIGFLGKHCCCSKRAGALSEEETVRTLLPVFTVFLHRGEGEKLGLGINQTPTDTFTITAVNSGAVEKWNSNEAPGELRKMRVGDHIIAVTGRAGKKVAGCTAMADALKQSGDITLEVVLMHRREPLMTAATSFVLLKDLALKDVAQLRPAQATFLPEGNQGGIEIASLGPGLEAWNANRKQEGCCALQTLEVGDRVLSINGSQDIKGMSAVNGATLLLCRFRALGVLQTQMVEVNIQKTSKDDRLGMQIRHVPGTQSIEVLEVMPGGAVSRTNGAGNQPQILRGDRITSVNEKKEFTTMQQELGASETLRLAVERWGDGGAPAAAAPAPSPQSTFAGAGPVAARASLAPAPMKPSAPPAPRPAPAGSAQSDESLGSLLGFVVGIVGLSVALPVVHSTIMSAVTELLSYTAAGLMCVGSLFALRFVWYELTMFSRPSERNLFRQLMLALIASVLLGYADIFLVAWSGGAVA